MIELSWNILVVCWYGFWCVAVLGATVLVVVGVVLVLVYVAQHSKELLK